MLESLFSVLLCVLESLFSGSLLICMEEAVSSADHHCFVCRKQSLQENTVALEWKKHERVTITLYGGNSFISGSTLLSKKKKMSSADHHCLVWRKVSYVRHHVHRGESPSTLGQHWCVNKVITTTADVHSTALLILTALEAGQDWRNRSPDCRTEKCRSSSQTQSCRTHANTGL